MGSLFLYQIPLPPVRFFSTLQSPILPSFRCFVKVVRVVVEVVFKTSLKKLKWYI
jgi:hypothetical protein